MSGPAGGTGPRCAALVARLPGRDGHRGGSRARGLVWWRCSTLGGEGVFAAGARSMSPTASLPGVGQGRAGPPVSPTATIQHEFLHPVPGGVLRCPGRDFASPGRAANREQTGAGARRGFPLRQRTTEGGRPCQALTRRWPGGAEVGVAVAGGGSAGAPFGWAFGLEA